MTTGQAHAKRKRIFASAYSKTSIAQDRTQRLIKSRVSKLLSFIESQTNAVSSDEGGHPVIVRHLFRALQADIFTAFAFSDVEGSAFLDNLKCGANTMEDLGMHDLDLFHDDRREEFFFWESERPFKYVGRFIARNALKTHARAERWLCDFVSRYESKLELADSLKLSDTGFKMFNGGIFDRLRSHRSPETGQGLQWRERASEVMDHVGRRMMTL